MAGVDFLRVSGNNMDMQVVRRDTATFSLTWGGETPVDVTGYTASCIIKQSVDHSDSVAEFDVAVGNTDGLIAFSLDTVLPARFSGVYELRVVTDTAVSYRVAHGRCLAV